MLKRSLSLLYTLTFLLNLPVLAQAQGSAALSADRIEVIAKDRLIASGNVHVTFEDTELFASKIIYTRKSDHIDIIGPIQLKEGQGRLLEANKASLDKQLEQGILYGARLVFERNLQLTAQKIERNGSETVSIFDVSATSCHVCSGQVPLWEIRAGRVQHDKSAKQLHFKNATLDVKGFPVFWLPTLRLPDPSVKRASGFLVPKVRTTNRLKTGIKTPYFIALSPDKDLTFTPYLSNRTATLETRYRQAFETGKINVITSVSDDHFSERLRYSALINGRLTWPTQHILSFNLKHASDTNYLQDYGYGFYDRLESFIMLEHARIKPTSRSFYFANISAFETYRANEQRSDLPPYVAELFYTRTNQLGTYGALTLAAGVDTVIRTPSSLSLSEQDLTRIGTRISWDKSWASQSGLRAHSQTALSLDYYDHRISQSEDTKRSTQLRVRPEQSVRLDWPLQRKNKGSYETLTPQIGILWSGHHGFAPENEDSNLSQTRFENLFETNRPYGQDQSQSGLSITTGVSWHKVWERGQSIAFNAGHIRRPNNTLSQASDPSSSQWIFSGQYHNDQQLYIDANSLWSTDFNLQNAHMKVQWQSPLYDVQAAYLWQKETTLMPENTLSELRLDTIAQLTERWKVSAGVHYDTQRKQATLADFGVKWQNECLKTEFSLSRQFTSSANIEPTTDFGLTITLGGFDISQETRSKTKENQSQDVKKRHTCSS